jgi:hypothetical protein
LSRAGVGGQRSLVLQTVHEQSTRKCVSVGSKPLKGPKQALNCYRCTHVPPPPHRTNGLHTHKQTTRGPHGVHAQSTRKPRATEADRCNPKGHFEVPLSRKITTNHAQRERCEQNGSLGPPTLARDNMRDPRLDDSFPVGVAG